MKCGLAVIQREVVLDPEGEGHGGETAFALPRRKEIVDVFNFIEKIAC